MRDSRGREKCGGTDPRSENAASTTKKRRSGPCSCNRTFSLWSWNRRLNLSKKIKLFSQFYSTLKLYTRFSQNHFFEVGSCIFLKTIASIYFSFCTLVLDMFLLSLNEGFLLFLITTYFIGRNRVKIYEKNDNFYKKSFKKFNF